MATITYENQTAETGKFVDSDNNVIDVQEFLESGQVLVTATASAGPVVPVAEATTPKYKNLSPWVGKFINSADEIIDLINFLTSGQITVQVSGAAMADATYITSTDETAALPNSVQLLGTNNQINVLNGLLSLSSTLIFPGSISFGGSSATVNDIDNTGTSFLSTELMTGLGTQLAIANAIDAGVSFRGGWDASGGTYPVTGGTGLAGAIEAGNWWYITTAGTLSGQDVSIGDWITALVNVPGQTGSNWLISAQGVNKVFNRIGNVVAELGDYSVDKITNGYNNTVSWVYSDVADGGAPLATYDATLGFTLGSFYRDSVSGYSYVCLDSGEDNAVWELLTPTSASYTDNVFSLSVNGNATDTEIVPLSPDGITYVAENGSDATGRVNSPAFPFYTLPAGVNALNAVSEKIGNILLVYPRGDATLYENTSIVGFNGWEIRGVGNNVIASDLLISDNAIGANVGGGRIANIYFNNLSISNFNDNIDGTTFEIGAFNDYVLDNEVSATNGLNSGNTFIDVEFIGSTIYFPSGYSRQINSITETYIGCKFSGVMTIHGTATQVKFIACQSLPTIVYANGATAAQVTIAENAVQKGYNVIIPFMSNKVVSGSGLATQASGSTIDIFSFNGASQFNYQYFAYLKRGVTYRFSCALLKTNDSGILNASILSEDGAITYNTLSAIDNYKSGSGATWNIVTRTFTFSPSGFQDGDWVKCILNCVCNSKNASSSGYYILGSDPNAGFSFCERYS